MHGIIWRGGIRLKLDVQGEGGERISDVDGQGVGDLENWTIFMDVIYASPLTKKETPALVYSCELNLLRI